MIDRPDASQAQSSEMMKFSLFGDTLGTLVRRVAVLLVGLGMWLAFDDWRGIYWSVTVQIVALSMDLVSVSRILPPRKRDLVAAALLVLARVSFASYPVILLIEGQDITAAIAAIALGIYMTVVARMPIAVPNWRAVDLAIIVAVVGVILVGWLLQSQMPTEQTILFAGVILGVGVYLVWVIHKMHCAPTVSESTARPLDARRETLEAMGRMSGGFAHDFNNILTAIRGNLELYRELPDSAQRDQLIDDALAASIRASTLVSHLLTFARHAPLSVRATPIHEIADALRDKVFTCLDDHARYVSALPPGLAQTPLRVDPDATVAALFELVKNAHEALETEGGEIVLSASIAPTTAGGGRFVDLTIADDGPGIPPDRMRFVLEPYFSTKSSGSGPGLGLPVAQGFAEQSGGTILLDSDETGTRATLRLPLETSPNTARGRPT